MSNSYVISGWNPRTEQVRIHIVEAKSADAALTLANAQPYAEDCTISVRKLEHSYSNRVMSDHDLWMDERACKMDACVECGYYEPINLNQAQCLLPLDENCPAYSVNMWGEE